MKLMFHLRSVKNLWTQNFHPMHSDVFERAPTDALDHALELDQRAATDQVLLPSVYKVPGRVGNLRRICGVQVSERHSRG
jgi:hypothetical protein